MNFLTIYYLSCALSLVSNFTSVRNLCLEMGKKTKNLILK